MHCKVQQPPWTLSVQGKLQILISICDRNQRISSPWGGKWIRNRCHHRRNGIIENPASRHSSHSSSGSYREPGRRFVYRPCNVHVRSCWMHLQSRLIDAPDGIACCTLRYGSHLKKRNRKISYCYNGIIESFLWLHIVTIWSRCDGVQQRIDSVEENYKKIFYLVWSH